MVVIDEDDYFAHFGTPRHSGRYPWGSGDQEHKTPRSFVDRADALKRDGHSDKAIADHFGMSIQDLRAFKSLAKSEIAESNYLQVMRLKEHGVSNPEIARKMGLKGESAVRAIVEKRQKDKADQLRATMEILKKHVDEKGMVDVGHGAELGINVAGKMGISQQKLDVALSALRAEGYPVYTGIKIPQPGTGKDTEFKVLAKPGMTWADVARNKHNIQQINAWSGDHGRTFNTIKPPLGIHPDRVDVKYAEDGGKKSDGMIYVRRGVDDVSLGGKSYAQVRIKVGDEHFLKGMAMYKDDLPKGVDLEFHTGKSKAELGNNKLDALKPLEKDPDLPFGSVISRQILDRPGHPDAKPTSVMNIINEEGRWGEWSNDLSAQVLSKQSPSLAREQLGKAYAKKEKEYKEIMALTNPTVKKELLQKFADGADSSAVHLKAANMPGQVTRVILPVNTMKPHEVYAPDFNNGDRVVLIRFPHAGTFEIPELTVNNKHRDARRLLGSARDAIGIHHSVAEHLSGADFDGDFVLVIPNNHKKIKVTPALTQLKDFDPKAAFPFYEGMNPMKKSQRGKEMGMITNLIQDMTIRQASHEELARAVKHSMVVIDAWKHKLNYRESARVHGIAALHRKYQQGSPGASTLISLSGSHEHRPELALRRARDGGPFDKTTGERVFVPTGRMRITKEGEKVPRLGRYNKLDLATNAHDLSSDTPIERVYAEHSNKLKSLANQARLSLDKTPLLQVQKNAKKVYSAEVASLQSKLTLAEMNRPRERQAIAFANSEIQAKLRAHPDLEKSDIKKIQAMALRNARARAGSDKKAVQIDITPKEWDAIQAGAISDNNLKKILANADLDKVKELAKPRPNRLMSPTNISRAQFMLKNGLTRAEVARQLGVGLTTLSRSLDAPTNVPEGGE